MNKIAASKREVLARCGDTAERAKMRAHKEAEKKIIKETAKAHAKANFKVGAAFAGVIGIGALFVMA